MSIPNLSDPFRTRGVTALLGPTNTGKTHYAIERMLAHRTGMIGLPLRLLAREVYQRLVDRVGADQVALVTGEEKIKPADPRYWVSTVEAMPRDLSVAFVAIDEIQLAADSERGHVFTDALLNRRGTEETILIGSSTIRPLIEEMLPRANVISRPRLSRLTFAGEKKLTRLPPRSAIVAFSAEEVYAIAELMRRERGGAAVVLGALSPRTRNAQVALFQNGDVEHIVATDAIGLGLNLEIDHVAFAADRKFDGHNHRRLTHAELGQIAGRAGRHLRDGTFGTTGRCPAFDEETVEALEEHRFDPLRLINWRNRDLDFASLSAVQASLAVVPTVPGIVRARPAEDEITLDILSARPVIRQLATSRAAVEMLWECCQLPDYRKVVPHVHADLVQSLYEPIMRKGRIDPTWFSAEIRSCDRTDGDISTLSARIAHIRTWTFCANRNGWLDNPQHWQNETRAIEDKLSDALHEKLAQRFIDRRTSVLMRRLRENTMLEAEITDAGDVLVESQHLGQIDGFRFTPDPRAEGPEAKALRAAAAKALAGEFERRARRLSEAGDDSFVLSLDGTIRWIGAPVARLQASEKALEPRLLLLVDDHLAGPNRELVEARLGLWLKTHINKLLGPLAALDGGESLTGSARGIAYQVAESLGVLDRAKVADIVKSLEQTQRAELRALGVRFGAYHIYTAGLMKPAPRALAAQLYALKHEPEATAVGEVSHLAASGRTSIPVDPKISRDLYRVAGFRVCGGRAVRVDILERLADLIRPALAWKSTDPGQAPAGAFEGGGFTVTGAMTSLVGCSGEDFASILASLGYRKDMKPVPPPKPVETPSAETQPATPEPAETPSEAAEPQADTAVAAAEPAAPGEMPVEAPAAEATAPEAAPEAPAAAEPELVAVWRPGRIDHGGNRHRPQHRRGPAGGEGDARPARADQGRPPRGDRSGPREDRGPRSDRPRDDRPREDRPPRDGKPGEKRFGGDGRGREDRRPGGKPDFRGNRDGKGASFAQRPERAPPRDKPMDPDSPFAKLLALKAQMEGKS